MTIEDDNYAEYVDHPRYGRGPKYTGLNPDSMAPEVQLHWNSTSLREIALRLHILTGTGQEWYYKAVLDTSEIKRIPNTAIIADLNRQAAATVQVTHYFDLKRICRDCRKPFIFFAEEQKYWYEVLRFGLDSDCVRCVPCRKGHQVISHSRQRYEELFHISDRSTDENFEIVDCCLSLIEGSVFSPKRLQFVRTVLNRMRSSTDESIASRLNELASRVRAISS